MTVDKPIEAESLSLTVVILTFDEALHIARAIESVRSFAREIVVIDSFSTDATVDIARTAGARVLQHKFVNQAQQLQWGLDNGEVATDWILRLDADEVIEPDLAATIIDRLSTLPENVVGINFNRKQMFMGRWVKHGGRYPLSMLRLWRRGCGRVEDRWMDEHIVVTGGRTIDFTGGFADIPLRDLGFFTAKHNGYATREAIEVIAKHYELFDDQSSEHQFGDAQVRRRRAIKERFYNKLPIGTGPLFYFLYRYFVQRGFLDGRAGLVYHVLQGFWYRFLVDAKVFELELGLVGATTREERLARLSALTGYAIGPRSSTIQSPQ